MPSPGLFDLKNTPKSRAGKGATLCKHNHSVAFPAPRSVAQISRLPGHSLRLLRTAHWSRKCAKDRKSKSTRQGLPVKPPDLRQVVDPQQPMRPEHLRQSPRAGQTETPKPPTPPSYFRICNQQKNWHSVKFRPQTRHKPFTQSPSRLSSRCGHPGIKHDVRCHLPASSIPRLHTAGHTLPCTVPPLR